MTATVTDSYTPIRPAWSSPTDDSSDQMMAAFEEAYSKGRHCVVDVGNFPRTFTKGIVYDPAYVSIMGLKADWRFKGSMDYGIQATQKSNLNSDMFGQSLLSEIYGLKITADDTVNKVLAFEQDAAPNQENATAHVHDCEIRGGQYGHFMGNSSFMHKVDHCQFFEQKSACVGGAANIGNAGEEHFFHTCTFHDSAQFLDIKDGVNMDIIVRDSSIDYLNNGLFSLVAGRLALLEVHIEVNGDLKMNLDAGANVVVRGGVISRAGAGNQLVQIYGGGGYTTFDCVRESHTVGFDLSLVDANGRPTVSNRPDLLSFIRRRDEVPSHFTGPAHWNYINTDYAG